MSGTVCAEFSPPDLQGLVACLPGRTIPYDYVVPAYAVVSGSVNYKLSERWALAVNIENIFDKSYYSATASSAYGNWYGTPRSFTAALRGRW